MGRVSRIDQIRQHDKTRERAARTRFVAARINSWKEGHAQLLEAMRRSRLSKPGKLHTAKKIGVFAVNGGKPILLKSRKYIVGLPMAYSMQILWPNSQRRINFWGPMKRAIINKDVTSFNKLRSYIAQFWTKAAVVNECVIFDNKSAIPAMMSASEYLWWLFLNRQIVDTCEKCRECTLYDKNFKSTKTFNRAQSLPNLSGLNQELQLDFAGPILDCKGKKTFLLFAIDRFSKFPSVLITKTTDAKKVVNFLDSYIRTHGLPQSIRADHGSGFKNDMVKQFCSSRGIIHILSPVGDHRGSGLVECSIQTIERKLVTAKLDPNFVNLVRTIQQIVQDIRKCKHAVLNKSPVELHFGQKPKNEWSQAYRNIVNNASSAKGLERNLLTPDQIASQDYSRNRAKVVARGSASPTITPHYRPMFSLDGNVADSEPYKALADLVRAANKWSQYKRNLPAESGKLVLK